ncbi:SPFH domain-containing protein [Cerasicoccus arenae]|uniref:SPFH domain-containing protein n=1 Tax=Cerasicoccus arenae TaxID=424488 RepID=UPI001678717D|nr:SPFH domain-containing protein [Cerasicoccus arenae]MBK1856792.1 SPFH domain-containing protein [Cerasicoccus arenae]
MSIAIALLIGGLLLACVRTPAPGQALVRTGLGSTRATTGSVLVLPGVHQSESLDLTLTRIPLSFRGPNNPLISADQQLFDLEISLFFRVSAEESAILQAINHFSAQTLNDEPALVAAISDDVAQSIRTIAGNCSWSQIQSQPDDFKSSLSERLTILTPGLAVDSIALDHIDKFPPDISSRQSTRLL